MKASRAMAMTTPMNQSAFQKLPFAMDSPQLHGPRKGLPAVRKTAKVYPAGVTNANQASGRITTFPLTCRSSSAASASGTRASG